MDIDNIKLYANDRVLIPAKQRAKCELARIWRLLRGCWLTG